MTKRPSKPVLGTVRRLFLSYPFADEKFVDEVGLSLAIRGSVDTHSYADLRILHEDNGSVGFVEELAQQIALADVFVFFAGNQLGPIQAQELNCALTQGKPLMLVRLARRLPRGVDPTVFARTVRFASESTPEAREEWYVRRIMRCLDCREHVRAVHKPNFSLTSRSMGFRLSEAEQQALLEQERRVKAERPPQSQAARRARRRRLESERARLEQVIQALEFEISTLVPRARDRAKSGDDVRSGKELVRERERRQIELERVSAFCCAEPVDCTVFSPPQAARGSTIFVQAFVHHPDEASETEGLAKEFDEETQRRGFQSLEADVPLGSRLHFHLGMHGLTIDHPSRGLTWRHRPASVQFEVGVPADHPLNNVIGTVTVSQDSVPIGHIKFKLKIVAAAVPEPSEPTGDARRYGLAFISYASKDRAKVLERVQILRAVGIRYFQDILALDPGDRWERELYRHIDECDLFLLFWSHSAKKSKWVLREVRYAVARKGDDETLPPEIYPVIIEGPPVVRPPKDLAHLHFNDLLLNVIAYEKTHYPDGGFMEEIAG